MSGKKQGDFKVVIAYLTVCLIWGSTYLAIKIGVSKMPPGLFSGLRFLLAGALLFAFAKLRGYKFPQGISGIRGQIIIGLLFQGGLGLSAWVQQWVYSGLTSLVIATGPLFIALLDSFLPGGTKFGVRVWLGLLLGFSGVAFLVFAGGDNLAIDLWGGLLLLLSSALWAVATVFMQRLKSGGTTITNLSIQMLSGGLFLTLIGTALGEWPSLQFSTIGLYITLYLIIFGSIIGYGAYFYTLTKWSATKAGTYAYVNPVIAIFLGVLAGEQLTLNAILSAIAIIAGVLIVQFSGEKRERSFMRGHLEYVPKRPDVEP